MGTHTFVRAQEYPQPSGGIRQAVLRVALRQEIVIAFRTQRPVQLLREYIQVDRSLDKADDWTLAFHVIVLCAEILNYCYGGDAKTPDAWNELATRAQSWMDTKPIHFEPLLYRAPGEVSEEQVFPEIWLLNDCHGMPFPPLVEVTSSCSFMDPNSAVAAHHYYLICQILLVAHDPKRPQLGPRRIETTEVINVSIPLCL